MDSRTIDVEIFVGHILSRHGVHECFKWWFDEKTKAPNPI